jgi:hypothetical protein
VPVLIRMFFAGRNDPTKRWANHPVKGSRPPPWWRSSGFPQVHADAGPNSAYPRANGCPPCPVPVQRTTRFRPQPDRLILQSQSLSRSYGSALPTSLTYIILTTRGCSPWRPAADMGTAQQENHTAALGFSRADDSALDSARAAELYGDNIPISRQTVFRESHNTLQRKDNSSQGYRRRLRVCLRCRACLRRGSLLV